MNTDVIEHFVTEHSAAHVECQAGACVRHALQRMSALHDKSAAEWDATGKRLLAERDQLRADLAESRRQHEAIVQANEALRAVKESHRKASADAHHFEAVATNLREELDAANRTITQLRADAARVARDNLAGGRHNDTLAERLVETRALLRRWVDGQTCIPCGRCLICETYNALAPGSSTGEARSNCGECSDDGCDHMIEPAAPEPAPAKERCHANDGGEPFDRSLCMLDEASEGRCPPGRCLLAEGPGFAPASAQGTGEWMMTRDMTTEERLDALDKRVAALREEFDKHYHISGSKPMTYEEGQD